MNAADVRCRALIESTDALIVRTRQHVGMIHERIARQRQRIDCEAPVLRASRIFPSLVEAEVFDDSDAALLLRELTDPCSHCGSSAEPLVAAVRFRSGGVEMVLCGECYRGLADLTLGQAV